jgi:cell division protein FtsZ
MREMGKAMMGTGEASGEQRALTAAEAAIANPVIDDSSMKGAKGLLISITGGKDLTLYEVDEAATRIREEVDQDANIIVGATFDEALDGIIRVSVVATGIDKVALGQSEPAKEARAADLVSRAKVEPRAAATAEPGAVERAPAPTQATPAPIAVADAPPRTMPAAAPNEVENAAIAAVSAAILPPVTGVEDVTIRPLARSKPSLLLDPAANQPQEAAMPPAFIPPAPEPVANRPRMPRFEDLPMPAQNEIRAQRGEVQPAETPDKRRMSLLQRLASVGLGRREGEAETPPSPAMQPPPAMERPPMRPAPRQPDPQAEHPASAYGKRPPMQALDPHGRQAPVHNSSEDDQLDIPAFLRRQAN